VNSKRSVYLLLPLVLLVWGLIGWRIWAAASDPAPETGQLPTMALRAKPAAVRHRPTLLLTYGDPFKSGPSRNVLPPAGTLSVVSVPASGRAPGRQAASLNFAVRPVAPATAVASITWPQIKYLGVISHVGGNAQVALLAIDNQELVVKAGKSERGVQVLKLFRDSVQLGFSGQKKSFARNATN
jgi:hypothetical protein